jgi:hypothetical protein
MKWNGKYIFDLLNSDLMLVQINDIVASMMVLPNRQVFPLVSDSQFGYLRWSNPQVNITKSIKNKYQNI